MAMSAQGFGPQGFGLFDPAQEKDSCGVGFIADIKGRKSHKIVEDALTILLNLEHRGAVGADPRAGPVPSQPPAAEKDYGSGARGRAFFLEATFVPPGDLPRPAVPGCLSAALRRALALGGWPPARLFPVANPLRFASRSGGGPAWARALLATEIGQ